jgi:hypothetical protein
VQSSVDVCTPIRRHHYSIYTGQSILPQLPFHRDTYITDCIERCTCALLWNILHLHCFQSLANMGSQAIPTIDLSRALPTILFSKGTLTLLPAAFGSDNEAQDALVRRLREACEIHGFFEMTGHGVPESLLDEALQQSRLFIDLPIDIKEKYDKSMLV